MLRTGGQQARERSQRGSGQVRSSRVKLSQEDSRGNIFTWRVLSSTKLPFREGHAVVTGEGLHLNALSDQTPYFCDHITDVIKVVDQEAI